MKETKEAPTNFLPPYVIFYEFERGVLYYKGRRNDFLPLPTPEQVDNLLRAHRKIQGTRKWFWEVSKGVNGY